MRRCVWLTANGVATLSFASGSLAQKLMTGIYVLDRERSYRVELAISKGVAVPMPNRTRASARLRKFNTPSDGLKVARPLGRFSIKDDDKPQIVVSTNGDSIRGKLLDGQVFDVSAKMNGDAILLTCRSPRREPTEVWVDSERSTVYHAMGQDLVEENTILVRSSQGQFDIISFISD